MYKYTNKHMRRMHNKKKNAIRFANRRKRCYVIIIIIGGGDLGHDRIWSGLVDAPPPTDI